MPEMTFAVRWPNGTVQEWYSPSLVMHDHLQAGKRYTVDDFRQRSVAALAEAAERVRAKFGFACTAAAATAESITAASFAYSGSEVVEVVSMHPPLPQPATTMPREQS